MNGRSNWYSHVGHIVGLGREELGTISRIMEFLSWYWIR